MQHSATSDELSTYAVEISICATVNHTHTHTHIWGVCAALWGDLERSGPLQRGH